MVVFDSSMLLYLLQEEAGVVLHPVTGAPVPNVKGKVEHLIRNLQASRERIVIPTPVLAEILVISGPRAGETYELLAASMNFGFAAFDVRAAIEVAVQTSNAIQAGGKKGSASGSWAKVKYDRQIVAIAKVERASAIYSNDRDVAGFGEQEGIKVVAAWDLPDPPAAQSDLFTNSYP